MFVVDIYAGYLTYVDSARRLRRKYIRAPREYPVCVDVLQNKSTGVDWYLLTFLRVTLYIDLHIYVYYVNYNMLRLV